MQSPLEHSPELVTGLGLVTARWSALEDALADVLSALMKVDDVGHQMLYSMSSFSQRLDLVRASVRASISDGKEAKIIENLFNRIAKLWATRNQFAHAHYQHRTTYHNGMVVTLVQEDGFGVKPDAIGQKGPDVANFTFGYVKYAKNGNQTFVPINKGALQNHADAVLRRGRQLLLLAKCLHTDVVARRQPPELSYLNVSPRSPKYDGVVKPFAAHTRRGPLA